MVCDQPDARAFLIRDAESMAQPRYGLTPLIDGWETVPEMEDALGMPSGALQRTMVEYDKHAAIGEDPLWHKHSDWLRPLSTGPWGAFDLTPGKASYVAFTLGGLRTSVNAQVLGADGTPVTGLYAAGACASNIAQDSSGYASGIQLGEASFFGRRAGHDAVCG